MPESHFARIVLRPRIVVASGAAEGQVWRLVELAHRECNIAKSLLGEVIVEPEIELGPAHEG